MNIIEFKFNQYMDNNRKLLPQIQPILDAMKGTGSIIAGGFIRYLVCGGHNPTDIDIFTTSEEGLLKLVTNLQGIGCTAIVDTDMAIEYCFKKETDIPSTIQVIKPKFGSDPLSVLSTFDFRCVRGYMNPEGQIFLDQYFITDNQEKLLVIDGDLSYPLRTILRMFKYHKNGYKFTLDELTKVMNSYNSLSPEAKMEAVNATNFAIYQGVLSI